MEDKTNAVVDANANIRAIPTLVPSNNPPGQQTHRNAVSSHTPPSCLCVSSRSKLATNKSATTQSLSIAVLLLYCNLHSTYFLSEAAETNKENTWWGFMMIIYGLFYVSDYAPFTAARLQPSCSSFRKEPWLQPSSLRAARDGSWLQEVDSEWLTSPPKTRDPTAHSTARTTAESPWPRAYNVNEMRNKPSCDRVLTRWAVCVKKEGSS